MRVDIPVGPQLLLGTERDERQRYLVLGCQRPVNRIGSPQDEGETERDRRDKGGGMGAEGEKKRRGGQREGKSEKVHLI